MGALVSSRRAHAAALPPGAAPLVPPVVPAETDLGPVSTPGKLENPGTLEEIHKRCKEVMPVNFEGCKFMVNRGLNDRFNISQTITMSSMQPSGYKLGAAYVGTKKVSPTEQFPIILGEIDPDGNLNLNFIHQLTQSWRCRVVTQLQSMKLAAAQVSAEHQGDIHTATLTLSSGVVAAQYLQAVTQPLALGAEIVYQQSPKIPGGEIAVVSAAGRYATDDTEIAAKIGLAGIQLSYYKQASEQLQIGAEIQTSLRGQESVGTIGYQIQIPKAELVFRGMVDSNWNVGAVLEKRFPPLPFSFALSGMANQSKQQFRFGCGFIVG